MSAIKEHFHDEICQGQREAAEASKNKPVVARECRNCIYLLQDDCPESNGPEDSCDYFSVPVDR